ncbi:Mobile element protein [Geobacillus proteiniphilus]|uniref:Mobile element protein n=1 Tax=Geobacillus proteiniphilus TaxID=860353 RepID=A0A1Q5SR58_9BACL|nr:Mobile element protein [Geobacillus proteiniphilus]
MIRMEELTGIRKRATSAKEAGRSLHSWAFHQLQTMIAYNSYFATFA